MRFLLPLSSSVSDGVYDRLLWLDGEKVNDRKVISHFEESRTSKAVESLIRVLSCALFSNVRESLPLDLNNGESRECQTGFSLVAFAKLDWPAEKMHYFEFLFLVSLIVKIHYAPRYQVHNRLRLQIFWSRRNITETKYSYECRSFYTKSSNAQIKVLLLKLSTRLMRFWYFKWYVTNVNCTCTKHI